MVRSWRALQPVRVPQLSDLDHRILRGTAWVALSYGGSQAIGFVVLTVLARLLTPAAFGVVSLASIVIVVMTYLQESGLGMAVIRQRDELEQAAGTMWVFMVAASVVLYAAAFTLAPLLADLFRQPGLTDVVRVLALALIIRALGSASGALLERDLSFRTRTKGELAGAVAQAAFAIPLAVAGLGVWSLVIGQLANVATFSVAFWMLAPMRPNPRLYSWSTLRRLARFGRHITIGNVLGLVNSTSDNAVIGKLVGAAALGYYSVAWRVANLPALGLSYIVGRVMFPAYSTISDDLPAFRRAFVMNVQRVALVSLPVGLGILICSDSIVVGLFGDRWHPAVAPLRILAVFGLIRSFSATSGAVFQASGRPQLVYQIGLWHVGVLYAGLAVLAPRFGVNGVAWAMTIAAFCSFVPAWAIALRILALRLHDLLFELAGGFSCAVAVAAALVPIGVVVHPLGASLRLGILVLSGLVVYGIALVTVGRSELRSIASAVRSRGVAEL
jgi:O-antigen/teichoic acid export membrane protein